MEFNMANLRMGAAIIGVVMGTTFALPASADIESKADCEYEGGTVYDMPDESKVCIVQIRPEEYRNDEVYDGQQLGVNECNGVELNDGLFCKVTLVAGKKPKLTTKAEMEAAVAAQNSEAKDTMKDTVIDKAKEMVEDEAEKEAKKQAKKKVRDLIK